MYIGKSAYCPSFQIVGDNVGIYQHASHQSMQRKNRDHHWFHLYAALNRVNSTHLPDDKPIALVANLPLQTFIPSIEECNQLREEFRVLISRVIVENLPYFKEMESIIQRHIKHKYSSIMKQKSQLVSSVII